MHVYRPDTVAGLHKRRAGHLETLLHGVHVLASQIRHGELKSLTIIIGQNGVFVKKMP